MRERLPDWIKRGIINTEATRNVRKILKDNNLNTVCDSARCPNKNECYSSNTATFLILGKVCTRNCRFCCVESGIPDNPDINEPLHIAEAVRLLNLDYVVITSVTRDDLADGGASHFAETIRIIKEQNSFTKIEVLTPDFKGDRNALDQVINAAPDVFNHNIETVEKLYSQVRPQAIYDRSLEILQYVKSSNPDIMSKSGIMVGLGEEYDDIIQTLIDLRNHNCDIVTIGQYVQPSKNHLPVQKYYRPDEFDKLKQSAVELGFKYVVSAPLVRSSYNAKKILETRCSN